MSAATFATAYQILLGPAIFLNLSQMCPALPDCFSIFHRARNRSRFHLVKPCDGCRWPLATNSRPRTDICGLDSPPQTTNNHFIGDVRAADATTVFRFVQPSSTYDYIAQFPPVKIYPGTFFWAFCRINAGNVSNWRVCASLSYRFIASHCRTTASLPRASLFPKTWGAGEVNFSLTTRAFRRRRSVSLPKRSEHA